MLIERFTWKVSHLHQKEFIELLKAMLEAQGKTPRVCSYVFGDRETVTSDLQYETMADREQDIADFDYDQPEWIAWVEKYPDLAETGITCELLRLH
jgi:hypothetical protein